MEIVPSVADQPITAGSVVVRVNPNDRIRAAELVTRSTLITQVGNEMEFQYAKRMAGEIKAMTDEIEDSKKAAKRPFAAVEKAIDNLAREVGGPVESEQKRILALLGKHVEMLEARAKAEARKREEALQAQIKAEQARVRAAQEAQAKAEAEARAAKDEAGRIKAQAEADRRRAAAEQAQLASEMAGEISKIGEKPKVGLVQGGRVDHKWSFVLTDVAETVKQGSWRLLRWELDHHACQDSCRTQLEMNPNVEPTLPGIAVSRVTNVSVRGAARTE